MFFFSRFAHQMTADFIDFVENAFSARTDDYVTHENGSGAVSIYPDNSVVVWHKDDGVDSLISVHTFAEYGDACKRYVSDCIALDQMDADKADPTDSDAELDALRQKLTGN